MVQHITPAPKKQKPANRFVIILRGFLSYWL